MEKTALIREMGNMGGLNKLMRIDQAIEIAKTYKVRVILGLDPEIYGNHFEVIDQIDSYDFNKTEITINGDSYPWWEITKLNLIF